MGKVVQLFKPRSYTATVELLNGDVILETVHAYSIERAAKQLKLFYEGQYKYVTVHNPEVSYE